MMFNKYKWSSSSSSFYLICILIFLLQQHVEGQSNKVSSKLDFDEAEDKKKNTTDVPVIISGTRGGGGGGSGGGRAGSDGTIIKDREDEHERDVESKSGGREIIVDTGSTNGGSGKSGPPKIHGVRVTVDTGDTHKSKESKESVEITDLGKHKKRVGIHTDITFELTTDGDDNDRNVTSSEQKMDKEDASVPIFKGRSDGGSTTSVHKSRKHWNPNFSSERRGYDGGRRGGSSYGGGSVSGNDPYYPHYPYNIPVYTIADDRRSNAGGTGYRRGNDGWTHYVPSIWTTERPQYSEPYRPNSVNGYRTQSWKPCYCISSSADNRRRRSQTSQESGATTMRPTSSVIQVVDGKLKSPFSGK